MKTFFIVLITISASVTAHGRNLGGTDLLRDCRALVKDYDHPSSVLVTPDNVGASYCLGLVHGVQDMLTLTLGLEVPPDVTVEQSVRIVTKYLEDYPEELHIRDSQLVMQALVKAFPKKRP